MEILERPSEAVDIILERAGKDLRVATPLAAGKPNALLNALYDRAKADPTIRLSIFTALTLERPKGKSDLERRFLEPMVERVFGNYPDLHYELDRVGGTLPPNVRIHEFYFPAGKFMDNAQAQRDYISTNYTYVARDLLDRGVNVLVQEVAWREEANGRRRVSLSSNADVTLDLLEALQGREDAIFVAQTNGELPFMFGDAALPADIFHLVIHNPELDHTVFGPPKLSVSDTDYLIGLHASTLVKDGGELQIGIGSLGDSLAYCLKLRHERNDVYRAVLEAVGVEEHYGSVLARRGDTAPFDKGLFAATEMLVDGFQHLYEAGILKRRVYDDVPLQRLLNEELITESVTPDTLRLLLERRAISARLTDRDVGYLVHFGVLQKGVRLDDGDLVLPNGVRVVADLHDEDAFRAICEGALGERLAHGEVIHAGFFLGPASFYRWLKDMPDDERRLINMRSVRRINQLYGHESIDRLHRRDARFVNTGMMVTLLGAVVSDALEDGRVVSGVGGQYNFVAMAHALPDGHSVIQIRSTRTHRGQVRSNIVWSYGHTTIPRHQRDLIVTEYGVADLRGRSDEEVIKAVLSVCDARFLDDLADEAKEKGKLSPDYVIPDRYRQNTPERCDAVLARFKKDGLFPAFPFGTDLTDEEIILGGALKRLRAKTDRRTGALEAMGEALVEGGVDTAVAPYLRRMGLEHPTSLKETLYQRLLAAELRHDPRVQDG